VVGAYSPEKTGFKVLTTKTLHTVSETTEVWVGGKVVFIRPDLLQEVKEALNEHRLPSCHYK
jgi:hypothetical protein